MAYQGVERRGRGIGNRSRRLIVAAFIVTYRRQAETTVAFIVLVSGLWLALPLVSFSGASAYTWLETLGVPESAFGLALAAAGGFGLVAVLRGPPALRSASLLAMLGVCVFLAVAFWRGNPASLGVAFYAALATVAFVALVYLEWAEGWTSRRGS